MLAGYSWLGTKVISDKMYPEAQASICIYVKLTAGTEFGSPEIQLNKDYHSPSDFFITRPSSSILSMLLNCLFSSQHFNMLLWQGTLKGTIIAATAPHTTPFYLKKNLKKNQKQNWSTKNTTLRKEVTLNLCTEKEAISGKPQPHRAMLPYHCPVPAIPIPCAGVWGFVFFCRTAVELIESTLLAQTQASYHNLNVVHCQAEVAICLHAFSPLQLRENTI